MNDLVSVIIPTYKGSDSICIALESLYEQSFRNIEVIVSDDNGEGEDRVATSKVVDSFRNKLNIKYLKNEHVNGSHARNEGLKIATGEYICFLDDDDYFLPQYIERSVDMLKNNIDIDIVFFDVSIITREAICRKVTNDFIDYKDVILSRKEIGTGSNIFFRRTVYDNSFGFDERYLRFQDLEFIAKKLYSFKSIWVKEPLIIKYFNSNDNYLNYRKSLDMQLLFRDDMKKLNIISDTEYKQMADVQLHNLYKDMIAKNMKSEDIKFVLNKMKENGLAGFLDKSMYFVYCISNRVFNAVFNIYMRLKYGNKKDLKAEDLLEYRKKLKELWNVENI